MRDRHDHFQTSDGLLQIAEFADPFQVVAAGDRHRFIDLLLRFEHRGAQIAAAHAELDRDVAFLILAVDERGA